MKEICNEERVILERLTSNEWISRSNEQQVKSYASSNALQKTIQQSEIFVMTFNPGKLIYLGLQ